MKLNGELCHGCPYHFHIDYGPVGHIPHLECRLWIRTNDPDRWIRMKKEVPPICPRFMEYVVLTQEGVKPS